MNFVTDDWAIDEASQNKNPTPLGLFPKNPCRMLIDLTEERKLEEKSLTSQSTSARKVQAKHFSIPDSDLKGFEWEPPKQAEDVEIGKTIADCKWSV